MDICTFLDESYTAYHAVHNAEAILKENGFEKLELSKVWTLKKGGCYYATQNGSSLVAFRIGTNCGFSICESHTDSPSLKLKGSDTLLSCGVHRLNVEKYGGGLLYSFLDRPLKIAGRVLVETSDGICQKLVTSDYNVVVPSLAIHHNPTANDNLSINAQNDVLPLFSDSKKDVYATLTSEKVVDADLYAVPAAKSFWAGAEKEYLCSSRIDNLTSVYAGLTALCQAQPKNVAVVACLDNEEVGSGTRQGNPSLILRILQKIQFSLGWTEAQTATAYQDGVVVSVDNCHAVHPAHPEKSDPRSTVNMNGGVVIKHHSNYATDGLSAAIVKRLWKEIPLQDYYNRSDVRCGSTLGLATARTLGMATCDVGLAQLAMHSACETVGAHDIQTLIGALKLFLSSRFVTEGDSVAIE